MNRLKPVFVGWILAAVFLPGCALFRPPMVHPKTPVEEVKRQIHRGGSSELTVGVAKVEITPPVGTPLAGYSKRHGQPSTGIRDPLYLRVLALSDGEDLVVVVSADILVYPHPWAQELIEKLSKEFKIPRQAFILCATHTHSGTGSIAQGFLHEQVFGPYRSQVVDGIAGRLEFAVRQAIEHRHPVRWALASNKHLLNGLIENRMNPSGFIDPSMSVLLFESPEGKPEAMLVSAAAHPTLMDSQDLRISADYPGELTQVMETTYPGAVCLFVNGAAGDLRPRDAVGLNSDERIIRFGKALAEGATGLINQANLRAKGDVAAWGWTVPLPPPQFSIGPIPIHPSIMRLARPSSAFLNLCALDEVILVPLPVELTTEYGQNLRVKLSAQGNQPIVIGYANGYLGYAVTPQQYEGKSYEAWMTWYGPNFGASVAEEIWLLAALYPSKEASNKP